MRIPFDSLCSTQWAAYSDYCREGGREKAADFAAKVSRSLSKFAAVKADPSARLATWMYRIARGGERIVTAGFCVKKGVIQEYLDTNFGYEYGYARWIRPAQGYPFWVTDRQTVKKFNDRLDCPKLLPADLPDPWKYAKLSFKFFKLLNRRATGIAVNV